MKHYYDKRYKATIKYLEEGIGKPIYKRSAFPHIKQVLGPIRNWVHLSAEEYFGDDKIEEAREAMRILSFTKESTMQNIKKTYFKLSQGSSKDNISGWHPDTGGHEGAFAILNHAYNIFKIANEKEI